MIMLDGSFYGCLQTNYTPQPVKLASQDYGLTGKLLKSELGVSLPNNPKFTLRVLPSDVAALEASFHKTGFVDFTNEEGVSYLAGTGSDTDTEFYSTGADFRVMGPERPATSIGLNDNNLLLIDIELAINAVI